MGMFGKGITIPVSLAWQDVTKGILAADVFKKIGASIQDFVKSSIDAFSKQELAIAKLSQAMKNNGTYSEALRDKYIRFSEVLQKNTAYADEDINAVQGLLSTFGLAGQQLNDTTKAVLDLSTALGVDLETGAKLLGKAYAGNTAALSRYGIVVDESIPKNKRFEAVMAQLQKRFGGSAEAELNTYSGQVRNLANSWDNFKEKVGGKIIPLLVGRNGLVQLLSDVVERLNQMDGSMIRSAPPAYKLSLEIAELKNKLKELEKSGLGVGETYAAREKKISDLKIKIAELTALELDEAEKAGKSQEELDKIAQKRLDEIARLERARETEAKTHDQVIQKKKKKEIEASELTKELAELSVKAIREGGAEGLRTYIQQKLDEVMATQITRLAELYMAAPATFGASLAGIAPILAAAAAATAALQSIKLSEGGIVPARPGGTLATLGEGGSPEAVIPLNKAGIGGNITVNINSTFPPTERDARLIAKMIDRELYKRQRKGLSVAI